MTPSIDAELDSWVCKQGHVGNRYIRPNGESRCRTCRNARNREWYLRNQTLKNAKSKTYNESHRDRLRETAYKRLDPIKHKARQAVNNAVKSGKFTKQSCSQCGEPKTDFHHSNGYDKPNWFTGTWLCRKDHLKLHRELRWKI